MFQWIEKLKEIAAEQNTNTQSDEITDKKIEEIIHETNDVRDCGKYDISHGSVIRDRKSTFQAHVCVIQSQHDVK